jgi:hypothetical protein
MRKLQCATMISSIYLNLISEHFIKLNVYSDMYMETNIDNIVLQKLLKLLNVLSNLRSWQISGQQYLTEGYLEHFQDL